MDCFRSGNCFSLAHSYDMYVEMPRTGSSHLVDAGDSTLIPARFSCDVTGACWGLATSTAGTAYLGQSVDGGVTWRGVPNVGLDRPTRELVLSCVDLATCVSAWWAHVGGVQFAFTTDGGRHWASRPLPGFTGVDVLHCASSRVCFMSLERARGSSRLLQSDDGGESWYVTRPAIPHMTGLPSCTSRDRCWAWGATSVPDDYGPQLFSSTDGGRAWNQVDIPQTLFTFVDGPWCSTDERCWAFGLDSESRSSALISTADGGRNWELRQVTGRGPSMIDPVSCPSATECVGMSQAQAFVSFPQTWVLSVGRTASS